MRFVLAATALLMIAMIPIPAGAWSAYDLQQLHPDVRAAAAAARAIEAPAPEAAARAREAAVRAEGSAQSARNGQEGYRVNARDSDPQRRRYEGQWASDVSQGLGILTFGAGEFQGDRYAGEFSCGRKHGFGVYRYAAIPGDRAESRYEGAYESGRWSGLALYYARDGAHYAGEFGPRGMSGVGVHYSANGLRYEGQFADNRPNGYGVLWDARGRVRRAGIFQNARLVTRLGSDEASQGVAIAQATRESGPPTCIDALADER